MSVHFHMGMKVVCICDFAEVVQCGLVHAAPVVDQVYTIRGVEPGHGPRVGRLFLLLEEVRNPIYPGNCSETSFCADSFRPLVEKKSETDISDLKKLLLPTRERETA